MITLTSTERRKTITIEVCFNAGETYVPPILIYSRKRVKQELLNGAPPNSWTEYSHSD